MGFASGAITFRRYYLGGRYPDSLSEEWLAAIAAHAFGRQDDVLSDGTETGWIVPNHLFDVDFSSPERITLGRFVFLAMRLDRTAPPPAIVRSYQKMEEAAALEAGGREFLSRTERRLAKEAAQARAEKETRDGQFRRTTAYPLLIDLSEGIVYFGNLGAAGGDRLSTLFSDTFATTLVPAATEEVAYRIATKQGSLQAYEDAKPAHLVGPPAVTGEAESTAFPGQDRSFLGWEFLTWLWFRADTGEGLFDLEGGGAVTVAIDRLVHLVCGYDLTGTTTVRTDVPVRSPEARAALGIGKVPTKMGLLVGTAHDEWAFTLDGLGYNVAGLSVARSEEKDAWAILEHRFSQVGELGAVLDGLLGLFLRSRLQSGWKQELAAMRRWVAPNDREVRDLRQVQRATA